MRELSVLLAKHGIKFDPIDWRIMCFPHILNLCSGHIVDQYMNVKLVSITEAWVDVLDPTIVVDKDIYLEALQQDPVALGRNIVCLVCTSSLCHKAFDNTIITGNQMQWFTDEDGNPTELPLLELIRDMKSCWDSIYLMINRLCILRQVHSALLRVVVIMLTSFIGTGHFLQGSSTPRHRHHWSWRNALANIRGPGNSPRCKCYHIAYSAPCPHTVVLIT